MLQCSPSEWLPLARGDTGSESIAQLLSANIITSAERCYVSRLVRFQLRPRSVETERAESTIGKSRDSVSTNINTFTVSNSRRNCYDGSIISNIGETS
jgi:hypothetical protein